jgi:Capsule polysaccharide biosynthesis protein
VTKPVVLFFARGYQADFFPTLSSDRYQLIFATLTKSERLRVESRGGRVVGSFEEDYGSLPAVAITDDYLVTSFMSDRFLGRYCYEKRLEILGKEVSFWTRIFDTHSPIAVVNELVAIEISEVLLIECRARNIRYLAGMSWPLEDYFYWLANPLSLSGRYLPEIAPGAASLELARKYVQEVRQREYKAYYIKNLSARRSVKPLAAAAVKLLVWSLRKATSAVSGSFQYEMYDEEYAKRVAVYAKSFARRYDAIGDLPAGREVIYYPLHQEPEAALNYMSEFYSNQPATIENILKCLDVNQVLVVKEHPIDKGSLLRRKFWNLRKSCSSLFFFPAELHGRDVLAAAHRVVTLASTAAWEAALMGKPVYVLGQIFYDQLRVLKAVSNFEELKRELRTNVSATEPDAQYMEHFVARMIEQSYPGNPFPHADLYSDRNKRRVADAIAHALDIHERS